MFLRFNPWRLAATYPVQWWMHGCTSSTTTQISHCRGCQDTCFASTNTVVDWMLSLETDPSGCRVAAFECGLKTNLSGRHHLVDLHDFDMVSVSVLEVDHYYLIVFDLEDERIYLIDHLGDLGLVCF
ncbi:hypothetical protein HanPI659440_Chr02g0049091 [Helianthus annuus]|nr:hypothetical protein HanPI659440_Chr02g0049091 [Helianthus annuus]